MVSVMIRHGQDHNCLQIHHADATAFIADGQTLARHAQRLLTTYGCSTPLTIVGLPVSPDPSSAQYGEAYADQRVEHGEAFILLQWSNTDVQRATATITHEVGHHLRRQHDPKQNDLPLTRKLLHEGLAERLVDVECGSQYLLYVRPTPAELRQCVTILVTKELVGTPLTPEEEQDRTVLLNGDSYYPAAYAIAKKTGKSVQELITVELSEYAQDILDQLPHI